MASTKDVLDHHLKAFDQGELNGVDERYVYRAAVEMVGPPNGVARALRPIDEGIGAADETGSGERREDERSRAHEQRLKIERTRDSLDCIGPSRPPAYCIHATSPSYVAELSRHFYE